MPALLHSVMEITSPTTTNTEDNVIRGFITLEVEDRSGHIVDPDELNIKAFLAAPTLLWNHDFFRDYAGNKIAIGKFNYAHIVKLRRIPGDSEYFDVVSEETGEVLDKFPKIRLPDVKPGTRGIYAEVEVTEPTIWEKVKRGEVTSFSWKGLAEKTYDLNPATNEVRTRLKDVDLYEISLVNMPVNRNANFLVKSSILKSLSFNKKDFNNIEIVRDFLIKHAVNDCVLSEEKSEFLAAFRPLNDFDQSSIVSKSLMPGITAVYGNFTEATQKSIYERDFAVILDDDKRYVLIQDNINDSLKQILLIPNEVPYVAIKGGYIKLLEIAKEKNFSISPEILIDVNKKLGTLEEDLLEKAILKSLPDTAFAFSNGEINELGNSKERDYPIFSKEAVSKSLGEVTKFVGAYRTKKEVIKNIVAAATKFNVEISKEVREEYNRLTNPLNIIRSLLAER